MASPSSGSAPPPEEVGGPDYKTRLPSLAPGHIIAGGHVLSAVAVMTLCVASAEGDGSRLPRLALVFFALSSAVRLVLFRERLGPPALSGVHMSLGAAALFVGNAAASVATLVREDLILRLIAYSALDVTARWLDMVASAKSPAPSSFRAVVLALDLGADAYVCALVGSAPRVEMYALPAFVAKAVYDVGLLVSAAATVLDRDARKHEANKDE